MAWKFLNIGKANAEIERLEKELATIKAERDEARTALESNNSEAVKAAEGFQADLAIARTELEAAKGQVTKLTNDLSAATTELTTVKAELVTAKAQIADPAGVIQKAASAKAAEITSSQGQPPVKVDPTTSPAAPGKEQSGLTGIARVQAAFKKQMAPRDS